MTHPYAISLVIPLFNEEDNVAPLIERVRSGMAEFRGSWELVLVDDGSVDATLARAKQIAAKDPSRSIKVVELQRNFGQTSAMQAGIDLASGRLIATLDGDLQNDPHDIPAMAEQLEARELDLLVGWRKDRKDNYLVRKVPSWIANWLIGRMTGVKLHDYGCSLKIYRASVIKQVKLLGEMHRFIPAWVAAVAPSSRIGEMEVNHNARLHGTSKYGLSRSVRVIIDLLSVWFFMRYKARPGHFFGMIGLSLGALASLIMLYLGFDKFVLGNDIGTRPLLLIGVVLFLSAMQMMTTGVLSEMVSRTYYDSTDSAHYVVRQVFPENLKRVA